MGIPTCQNGIGYGGLRYCVAYQLHQRKSSEIGKSRTDQLAGWLSRHGRGRRLLWILVSTRHLATRCFPCGRDLSQSDLWWIPREGGVPWVPASLVRACILGGWKITGWSIIIIIIINTHSSLMASPPVALYQMVEPTGSLYIVSWLWIKGECHQPKRNQKFPNRIDQGKAFGSLILDTTLCFF